MTPEITPVRYRFGVFEVDSGTGELRRKGLLVKLHQHPLQVLLLLLARPGEMLTREEICRELWPQDTFVDFEHGVNSAVNRLREALGDKASNPRFVETLARRGYRFVAPVERVGEVAIGLVAPVEAAPAGGLLAAPEDLPVVPVRVARTLYLLLQLMYLGFYVGALANLAEINELFSGLPGATELLLGLILTAALLIPVRVFAAGAVVFQAPRARERLLTLWWYLVAADVVWALAPFLLLHHMSYGLALACVAPLLYAPFAQRSLVLMGAAAG